MSLYGRERKKRIRYFKKYQAKDSIKVQEWEFWTHHLIPDKVEKDDWFDFWAFNGKDVLLISLFNSENSIRQIKQIDPRDSLRIIIKMPIKQIDQEELESIVKIINSGKITKIKKKR